MFLIDRHLFREWMQTLWLTLGATLGLVVLADMGDNLPDFMVSKSRLGDVLAYYTDVVAVSIPTVLPLAFLLSLLISLGRLHKNSEITAMRAAGLSLLRITRPLWVAGLAVSLLMLALVTTWGPASNERIKLFLDGVQSRKTAVVQDRQNPGVMAPAEMFPLTALVHVDRNSGQIWFVDGLNVGAGRARGVTVHFLDEGGAETVRVVAAEAEYREGRWTLRDGRLLKFNQGGASIWFSRPFGHPAADAEKTRFELTLAGPTQRPALKETLAFQEEVLSWTGRLSVSPQKLRADHGAKRISELSFSQINEALPRLLADEGNPKAAEYQTRYHQLLASPLLCLILVGIAAPLSTSGVRINPMIGLGKALGWFVLHIVVSEFFSTLGSNRVIPAWLAAWLPVLFLSAVAAHLWRKAR